MRISFGLVQKSPEIGGKWCLLYLVAGRMWGWSVFSGVLNESKERNI